MVDLDKYFKVANTISDKVSKFLLRNFGGTKEMDRKSEGHYGIAEDIKSNEMYESYLRQKTPEVALYTEEGERNLDNDLVWIIDPLDGTSNYRAGNPFFNTQIALLYKSEPVLAIVNAPVLKQKFHAIKGCGSFLNKKTNKPTNLQDLSKSLVEITRGLKDSDKKWSVKTLGKIIKHVRTSRSFGSAGLSLSYTAAGIIDVYISSGTQIYDYLPGSLIVKEAGGVILGKKGEKWNSASNFMIASNLKLATETAKLIR